MNALVMFVVLILASLVASDSEARREIRTPKQKERLLKADRVLLDILALTDKGEVDTSRITDIASRRMKELGYTVLLDRGQPYDLKFRIKCEQRKVWQGTNPSGGDADLPDSPSRVWKGPACQLGYLLRGRDLGWRKEVRTDFQDSIKAAAEAGGQDPGAYALDRLLVKLERYDFPVLVTADWGQVGRLLKLLDDPNTAEPRQIKVISVLGDILASDAVPRLSAEVSNPNLEIAHAAIVALGKIGKQETIPLLAKLLKSGRPETQPAAAKALGRVGALNFDFSVVDPLLEALKSDHVQVKIEVAWALGRLPDRRSYQPLLDLHNSLHTGKEAKVSPEIAELRKALSWSLKQVDWYDQIN